MNTLNLFSNTGEKMMLDISFNRIIHFKMFNIYLLNNVLLLEHFNNNMK